MIFQSEMAPRYEICVGLEKGHKTTPNTLVAKPSKKKVGRKVQHFELNDLSPTAQIRQPS